MAWFLDGTLLLNVTKAALTAKTNPDDANQTVGPRLVPVEPMSLLLNVASSDYWQPLDPDLTYPQAMGVDWVRLYQSPGRHSTGCDPASHPTRAYIEANRDKFRVPDCGNGACEAGECEQCPRDCALQAACRQDCRVPRCQVRDGAFAADPAGQWGLHVDPRAAAAIDWRPGASGAVLTVTGSGSQAHHVSVYQSAVLLCQGFRYRVSATLRSVSGAGQAAVAVLGSAGGSDLLPSPLGAAFNDTQAVTLEQDFEVGQRHSSAQVAPSAPPPLDHQGRTPWAEVAFWIPTQEGGCPRQCGGLLVIAEGSRAKGQ